MGGRELGLVGAQRVEDARPAATTHELRGHTRLWPSAKRYPVRCCACGEAFFIPTGNKFRERYLRILAEVRSSGVGWHNHITHTGDCYARASALRALASTDAGNGRDAYGNFASFPCPWCPP